jgi:hypothetical protein
MYILVCIISAMGIEVLNCPSDTSSFIDHQDFTQIKYPGYVQLNYQNIQFTNDDESDIKSEYNQSFRLEQPVQKLALQQPCGTKRLYLLFPLLVDLPPPYIS